MQRQRIDWGWFRGWGLIIFVYTNMCSSEDLRCTSCVPIIGDIVGRADGKALNKLYGFMFIKGRCNIEAGQVGHRIMRYCMAPRNLLKVSGHYLQILLKVLFLRICLVMDLFRALAGCGKTFGMIECRVSHSMSYEWCNECGLVEQCLSWLAKRDDFYRKLFCGNCLWM